jgi:hypothetical protein
MILKPVVNLPYWCHLIPLNPFEHNVIGYLNQPWDIWSYHNDVCDPLTYTLSCHLKKVKICEDFFELCVCFKFSKFANTHEMSKSKGISIMC